jgi:hypothetical protein
VRRRRVVREPSADEQQHQRPDEEQQQHEGVAELPQAAKAAAWVLMVEHRVEAAGDPRIHLLAR